MAQVQITSSPTRISGLSMTLSAFTGGDGVSGVAGPLRHQLRCDVKLPWSPCQSSEDLDSTIGWKSCGSLHSWPQLFKRWIALSTG